MKASSLIKVFLIFLLLKRHFYLQNRPFIRVFNVGQGDSILIDNKILVDGGGNHEVDRYLSGLSLFNACNIDVIVLSHPHYDHLKGLNRVLERCNVGRIAYIPVEYDSSAYSHWKYLLKDETVVVPLSGDVYDFDDFEIEFIWPLDLDTRYSNINNSSLSFLLSKGDFRALFLGDMEVSALRQLDFAELVDVELDVLKVPHHGGESSLYDGLSSLRPKFCMISLGEDNVYRHPHQAVLDFYDELECEIFRTDLEGTIDLYVESE